MPKVHLVRVAVCMSLLWLLQIWNTCPAAGFRWDVRDHGAAGDGVALDTVAINRALDACAAAGGGEVRFPSGAYLTGTLRLRSHVHLVLDPGATLIGTTNVDLYLQPTPPDYMPEARWGKWHRGLLIGEGVEDVSITGPGTINGNKVFDPTGEEHMRGPHGIVLVGCRGVVLRDFTIVDAANYAIYCEVTDDVDAHNLKIVGGWDGIHWRGAPERWCKNVSISGCRFYTGDDCIAGRYWDGTVISDCIFNSSCNGVRLIGPAQHLIVNNCLFYGPGLQPHRTSGEKRRTNMLAGIILQPGAWDSTRGVLDDVLLSRITMEHVAAPLTVWNKPGNTVGRVTVLGLDAIDVYRSALSFESWAETPMTNIVVRGARLEFAGGEKDDPDHRAMSGPGVDARKLPAWGIYARNVEKLQLEDIRCSLARPDTRPALMAESVGQLDVDQFRFPQVPAAANPVLLTNVGHLLWPDAPKPLRGN